jgi:hypothetical protein
VRGLSVHQSFGQSEAKGIAKTIGLPHPKETSSVVAPTLRTVENYFQGDNAYGSGVQDTRSHGFRKDIGCKRVGIWIKRVTNPAPCICQCLRDRMGSKWPRGLKPKA